MPFDLDLDWRRNRDEIVALADSADVIHLHNYLSLDSREFAPIDLMKFWNQGRAMVRQFHSAPEFVARFCRIDVAAVLNCPIPKLVIGQFQERYYPDAHLVPNIVFPVEAVSMPLSSSEVVRVGYAPSRFNSGRSSRWDTKGYPEVRKILRKLISTMAKRGRRIEVDFIENVAHSECLARKAKCHLVLDDLVTGSYHLNTLESLVQGTACMTYMDRRTLQAVSDLTGRNDFPAISVGLENAVEVLLELASSPELLLGIGKKSQKWMLEHWSPPKMAEHFLAAYGHVLQSPGLPFPRRFDDNPADVWLTSRLFDLQWQSRTRHWPQVTPKWVLDIKGLAGSGLRKIGLKN